MKSAKLQMISAVVRSPDHLDIFATDTGGRVLSAAWEPAYTDGWHGWWHIRGGRARPGAPVTAVSRRPDFMDIFVTGTDGGCYTASWSPSADWLGWWWIRDAVFPQGTYLSAVSRRLDYLDVFGTDGNGNIITAAWQPAFTDGWRGWWNINGGRAAYGSLITAVSRRPNFLDVFLVGTDGRVYTASWDPSRTAWGGWWPMGR